MLFFVCLSHSTWSTQRRRRCKEIRLKNLNWVLMSWIARLTNTIFLNFYLFYFSLSKLISKIDAGNSQCQLNKFQLSPVNWFAQKSFAHKIAYKNSQVAHVSIINENVQMSVREGWVWNNGYWLLRKTFQSALFELMQ